MHSVHSVDSFHRIHHSVRSKSGTHSVGQSASTRNRCSRTTEREQRSRMHSVQPVDLHQSLHSVGSKSRHTLRETKWKLKRQIQSTNRKRAEKPNVSSDRYNSKALGLLVSIFHRETFQRDLSRHGCQGSYWIVRIEFHRAGWTKLDGPIMRTGDSRHVHVLSGRGLGSRKCVVSGRLGDGREHGIVRIRCATVASVVRSKRESLFLFGFCRQAVEK
jgi:hypothetical protein